jgi:hypothetical protein
MLGAVRWGTTVFYAPFANAVQLNAIDDPVAREAAIRSFLQRWRRDYSGHGLPPRAD